MKFGFGFISGSIVTVGSFLVGALLGYAANDSMKRNERSRNYTSYRSYYDYYKEKHCMDRNDAEEKGEETK